jgi:hypothetical protein
MIVRTRLRAYAMKIFLATPYVFCVWLQDFSKIQVCETFENDPIAKAL